MAEMQQSKRFCPNCGNKLKSVGLVEAAYGFGGNEGYIFQHREGAQRECLLRFNVESGIFTFQRIP
jgi:hypothetical protein